MGQAERINKAVRDFEDALKLALGQLVVIDTGEMNLR
jgi:hypothetical protein